MILFWATSDKIKFYLLEVIKTIKKGADDIMKFILFLLSFLYVNNVALAEEKVKADYVAKQVNKYKEECFNKYAFPKGIDNYSM